MKDLYLIARRDFVGEAMNSISKLDIKKYLLTSVVVFIFLVIYQLVVTKLLGGVSGIEDIFFYIGHLLFALFFTLLFSVTNGEGIIHGLIYGVIVALLLMSVNFVSYMSGTLGLDVLIHWVLGDVLRLGLAGVLVVKLYLE